MASSLASIAAVRPASSVASLRKGRMSASRPVAMRAGRLAVRSKIDYVEPEEVSKLVEEKGYKLVDVRDTIQYERAHFVGVDHVPLYVEDTAKDVQSLLNQAAHAGSVGGQFGTKHTVRNTEFEAEMEKMFAKDDKLLLACQSGLRSNGAAMDLAKNGFSDLVCIQGGLEKMEEDMLGSLKVEGKDKISDAGKGGSSRYVREISTAVGGVMALLYLFFEFFPEQASALLIAMRN